MRTLLTWNVPANYGAVAAHNGGGYRLEERWDFERFLSHESDDLLLWPVKRYQKGGN